MVDLCVKDKGNITIDLIECSTFDVLVDTIYEKLGCETPIQFPDDITIVDSPYFEYIEEIEDMLDKSNS